MNSMRRFLALVFAVYLFAGLVGCRFSDAGDPTMTMQSTACGSVAYPMNNDNQRLIYFDCQQSQFGRSLSRYLEDHPDAQVAAMTGDGTCAYGVDCGYFVVFNLKK